MRRGRWTAAWVGAALACATAAGAAPASFPVVAAPGSGVEFELVRPFEVPQFGYLPVVLRIRNDTDRERAWQVRCEEGYRGSRDPRRMSRFEVSVGGKQERRFELMVPLSNLWVTERGVAGVSIEVSGFGAGGGVVMVPFNRGFGACQAAYGVFGLFQRAWPGVEAELSRRRQSALGSLMEAGALPADWRAYLGFHALWMGEEDWQAASPEVREALSLWIAQGGTLRLAIRNASEGHATALGLPGQGVKDGVRLHGLGSIRLFPHREDRAEEWMLEAVASDAEAFLPAVLAAGYRDQVRWPLLEALKPLGINPTAFLMFLILFGVAVGPFNLFYLCRKQRTRLLWTTPLISGGASLTLVVFILLRDGIGGEGRRLTAALTVPAEGGQTLDIVLQEQLSRTGALFSTGFRTEEPLWIEPLPMPWGGGAGRDLVVHQEREYSGGWFASRSLQGQFVQALRRGRGRVQLRLQSPLQVLSSLERPLAECFVLDRQGFPWRAPGAVVPGAWATLERSTPQALEDARARWLRAAGPRVRGAWDGVRGRPGWFYAWSEAGPGALPVGTMVTWKGGDLVYAGPCEATGRRP